MATTTKTFERHELQIVVETPQKEYSPEVPATGTQYLESRKILVSFIQFLVYTWNPAELQQKSPVVIWIGPPPVGEGLNLLTLMFPEVNWFIYPGPHRQDVGGAAAPLGGGAATSPERVIIFDATVSDANPGAGVFTDATADYWKLIQARDSNVFIFSQLTLSKDEADLRTDLIRQAAWVRTINPVASSLKLRLPYVTDPERKGSEFKYLWGPVFVQPWGPRQSTECRLIPVKDRTGDYVEKSFNTKEMESKLFWHNTVRRVSFNYPPIEGDGAVKYDMAAEFFTLSDYLHNRTKEPPSPRLILSFSQAIDRYTRSGTTPRVPGGIPTLGSVGPQVSAGVATPGKPLIPIRRGLVPVRK